jgi:hypothetical protein
MQKYKPIKLYKSLGDQAEEQDTYQAYKEKIELIKSLSYEDLYNIMRDTEDALKVVIRNEQKANISGILALTEMIVKLGNRFMEQNNYGPYAPPAKPAPINTEYTYEWMEKNPNP